MASPQLHVAGLPVWIAFDEAAAGGARAVVESVPESGGMQVSVLFKCAWSDRIAVYTGLLGSVRRNGNSFTRSLPVFYPDLPALYCRSIGETTAVKPRVRASDGWFDAAYAVFPAHFVAPQWDFANPFDASGKAWTTTRTRAASEVFVPPVGAYFYETGGKPVQDSSVGIFRPRIELSITRHWMPYIPIAESAAAEGHVNASAVQFGNYSFPVGTLLYVGMNTSTDVDTVGTVVQEVEYLALGNLDGHDWNQVFSPDGVWDYINTVPGGGGARPFPASNWIDTLP